MSGRIDKRVLALGPEAIDQYLERVLPVMVRRGGYIPTCDHRVPDNVSYQDHLYYRKRMLELDQPLRAGRRSRSISKLRRGG